jgi:hypothetical protein
MTADTSNPGTRGGGSFHLPSTPGDTVLLADLDTSPRPEMYKAYVKAERDITKRCLVVGGAPTIALPREGCRRSRSGTHPLTQL